MWHKHHPLEASNNDMSILSFSGAILWHRDQKQHSEQIIVEHNSDPIGVLTPTSCLIFALHLCIENMPDL